jgi:hypothetical protein
LRRERRFDCRDVGRENDIDVLETIENEGGYMGGYKLVLEAVLVGDDHMVALVHTGLKV